MCGVVGYYSEKPNKQDIDLVKQLIYQSKIRGLHAFGYTYIANNKTITNKIERLEDLNIPITNTLIYHNRYTTSGDHNESKNNQPLKHKNTYLVFPEYRVAVNVTSTDVIIMNNTHLIHGNTEFKAKHGTYNRISLVCYLREGILKCGTMQQEIDRAKKHGAFITKELQDD